MHGLYPIIRRVRRPLVVEAHQVKPVVVPAPIATVQPAASAAGEIAVAAADVQPAAPEPILPVDDLKPVKPARRKSRETQTAPNSPAA
jgi:hypothetical protein